MIVAPDEINKESPYLANNIEYNVRYENGKKYKDHWRAETKGLDDYLYMLQEQHVS